MSAPRLTLADGFALPAEAVTETFGILAVRGAGKTNAARVMAEQMFAAGLPFVAVDPVGSWWGLRSARDGKGPGLAVPIFGGRHGDVPLERGAGQLMADLVVDQRLSCVVDLSTFDSETSKKAFLLDFARRLYLRNEEPLHLFLEEADDYIPQRPMRDEAQLLRAFENLVRRGRARGLGMTLITQRSASINKSVLTQVQTLITLRTTGPQDRAAIEDWLKYHAQSREILETLPQLENGEAWVWSPQFLKRTARIRFGLSHTLDSGATPKHGKARAAATLADVDLEGVRARMAATIERARAEDPRELQKQVAALRAELARKPAAPPATVETVEKRILSDAQVKRLEAAVDRARDAAAVLLKRHAQQVDQLSQRLQVVVTEAGSLRDEIRAAIAASRNALTKGAGLAPAGAAGVTARPAPIRPRLRAATVPADGLTGPQQKILDAAAFLESLGIRQPDVVQLALFSGQTATGGYWRANIGRLRSLGLIEGTSLTETGRRGARASEIHTVEQLHEHVFTNLLVGPQRTILKVLIDAYPQGLSAEDVGRRAGLEPAGGYWRANVGRLRSLRLISKKGPLAALPVLFLEGA